MGEQLGKTITRTKKKCPPLIVGLTGGFGSGKTTTLHAFRSLGAKTFNCDTVAHRAVYKNSSVYTKLVRSFGSSIVRPSGAIDRAKLGTIIFNNPAKRAQLEKLIHPYVLEKMRSFIASNAGILVVEVPLLFEAHLEKFFDIIVVAACAQHHIIKRIRVKYPLFTEREIMQRIRAQKPLAYKKARADYRINTTTVQTLVHDTKNIWHIFLKHHTK